MQPSLGRISLLGRKSPDLKTADYIVLCQNTLFLSFRAERGISLSYFIYLKLNRREIPRSARNDKLKYFFRGLYGKRVVF
jgi:hypothetical protein